MLHGRYTGEHQEGVGSHSFEAEKAHKLDTLGSARGVPTFQMPKFTELLCTEPAPEPASDCTFSGFTADDFAAKSSESNLAHYMERPKVVPQKAKASMDSDDPHDIKGGDGDGSEGPLLTKLLANLMQPSEHPEDQVPDCIFWTKQRPYGHNAMSIML